MFYYIKYRKPEILHLLALNYSNCNEGEQSGNDGFLVHNSLFLYDFCREVTKSRTNEPSANPKSGCRG